LGRIIKALILGWIGKKIYERTVGDKSTDSAKRAKTSHVRRRASKRVAGKPQRRAA
jgi:hypothetical protein